MSKPKQPRTRKKPLVRHSMRSERDRVGMYIGQFATAAGQGALVELHLRMLAEVIPDTRAAAHEASYQTVEDVVCDYLAARGRIADAEREQLRNIRSLRNKLMHANLPVARRRARDLGAPPLEGGVLSIRLPESPGSGQEILDAIVNPREVTRVADKSKRGIFGWLLELGNAGDLDQAERQFRAAVRLVDELTTRVNDAFAEDQRARKGAAGQ